MDSESVAGHLVEKGSVFALLRDHRRVLFPDALRGPVSFREGRPSIPVDIIASILVLQALFGLSDREAMRAVRTDLQWQVACGLPVGHGGFDASVLTYWRRWLLASDSPNRIFEAVREVIAQTGAVKGKARRALDSTVLDDEVATQDTVTQLIAVIRKVRRDIPEAAGMVARVCSAQDYDDPGKRRIAWDDSEARQASVSALVNDVLALLAELEGVELDA